MERVTPELVLLDLGLPDQDGLETLARMKEEFPQVLAIVLTAQDSLNNAIQCIKLGAFHFISKPYAVEELLSLIRRALEQSELVRETRERCARRPKRSLEAPRTGREPRRRSASKAGRCAPSRS